MTNILFVGEKRSEKAVTMGVTWTDGRLAAKQLFDALEAIGIRPQVCHFTNWFEHGGKTTVLKFSGTVVAMGRKVEKELVKRRVNHLYIHHPAARGTIRKKENYTDHLKEQLKSIL